MTFTYKKSGVNYDLMDAFKNACLKTSENSSQFSEFPDFYLLDILEGLGSLNKLAEDIFDQNGKDFYYQVGWGNAASIINDLAATGATPLNIKLFVAAGNETWFIKRKRWQNLIKGFKEATKFSGTSWNGRETQTLTGLVNPKSMVLAGSATGIIKPKSKILSEDKIQVGDRIILLASSGPHTNGITLIRKVFKNNLDVLVAAIKNKTIIYSPLLNKLLGDKVEVHYASHITGHGWRKIMRPQRQLTYVIESIPKPQPIFKKIQTKTGMSIGQIYGDYNMGAGFALYAPMKSVSKILKTAAEMSIKALDAGFVKKGPRRVVINPIGVEFKGKDLQIR